MKNSKRDKEIGEEARERVERVVSRKRRNRFRISLSILRWMISERRKSWSSVKWG